MDILNKTEIMEPNTFVLVFGIFTIIFLFASISNLDSNVGVIFGLLFLICMVGALITSIWWEDNPTGRYKYEVILDDNYSATELYENYKVVEQRGKIWIIEDKEESIEN